MSMQWSWNGLTIRSTAEGRLRFESVPAGATFDADQAEAFADLLVALAHMAAVATVDAGADAAGAKAAVTKRASTALPTASAVEPASELTASKPAGAGVSRSAPTPKAAPGRKSAAAKAGPGAKPTTTTGDDDIGRSRQGTTIRIDGKPVKRGPRAAAARFAAAATAKRSQDKDSTAASVDSSVSAQSSAAAPLSGERAASPAVGQPASAGPGKASAGRLAASSATAGPSAPLEDISDLPPAVQEVVRNLDARARLLRPVVIWMARLGRPVTMDEIVAATKANQWSASESPQPALNATMQRAAQHFVRDHAGGFSLRALRSEAKVVVRRHSAVS